MRANELAVMPAADQSRLLTSGEVSARELLDACLEQYETHNPQLNAVVVTDIEKAEVAATNADEVHAAGRSLGPLHGVPMTIKDSIDLVGMPSTWGDPAHAEYHPGEDADVVRQLRAAGAVIYGKTNVPKHLGDWQTYNEIYGRTNNPWDTSRSAGGSSGGSAVSVATGMASLDVGSDIGGSIRWPANYTGLAGLKTSFGLISSHGHSFPGHEGTVDNNVLGPIARTVSDLSLALPVMWQPFMCPPRTAKASLADFTVGVMLENPLGAQDDTVTAALTNAVELLADAGMRIAEPPAMDFVLRGHHAGMEIGRAAASGPDGPPDPDALARYDDGERDYAALMAHASRVTYRQWIDLNNERERCRLGWRDYFANADLVITPVAPTTAPPHDTERPFGDQTVLVNGEERPVWEQWFWAGLANPTYLPALAMPVGLAPDGLPVGMQILGPFMGDLLTLRFGELAEEVLGRPLDRLFDAGTSR